MHCVDVDPLFCNHCIEQMPQVKPENLAVLVVVDFTKIGVVGTSMVNKHCTLLQKVLSRNQQRFLDSHGVLFAS